MTVPNETMGMREIITRFSRTGQVDSRLDRKGSFSEDPNFDSPDMEELNRMDVYDKHELAREIKEAREDRELQIKTANEKKLAEQKEKDKKLFQTNLPEGGDAPGADDRDTKERGTKERKGAGTKRSDSDGSY